MRCGLFAQAGGREAAAVEHAAAERGLVEPDAEDGFVDVLQRAQREQLGKKREGQVRIVDLAAQPVAREGEDLLMIEREGERSAVLPKRLYRITREYGRGDQGMGHVVLPTTNFDEVEEFYTEVLGFLPRGAVAMSRKGPDGKPLRVRFMGVNQRHHSLAICPAPHGDPPGLVHLMVEVDSLDAVGRALDEIGHRGFSVSSTLGRHTNDKMVSFYVRAPGGWDLEYGTEGMLVDERYYTAEEITRDSYWGHDWSGSEPLAAFVPPQRSARP